MIWGSLIVGVSIIMLMPTKCCSTPTRSSRRSRSPLFGLGLAFYATPSTDAALSALPDARPGAARASTRWRPPSARRSAVAISATVFTALSEGSKAVEWTEGVISYVGRQDNVNIREAGLAAFGVNLAFVVLAIISIMVTIPERKPEGDDAVVQAPMATSDAATSTQ